MDSEAPTFNLRNQKNTFLGGGALKATFPPPENVVFKLKHIFKALKILSHFICTDTLELISAF